MRLLRKDITQAFRAALSFSGVLAVWCALCAVTYFTMLVFYIGTGIVRCTHGHRGMP